MNTVLSNVNKSNSRFTFFENDQVLTADQLNDLFNYLDVQSRLTRTKAIGIGIICGLQMGLLETGQVVVSSGSALTTDGDLLHFDTDQLFDQYQLFEDENAKYPYFRSGEDQLVTMYELSNSKTSREEANKLGEFDRLTETFLKDYVGVLYLEEYLNDPDLCTGTDCDNKGQEMVRQMKVLMLHKDNMKLLLQSLPAINQNYFALDDIFIKRLQIDKNVDKFSELSAAFNNVLAVKKEIQEKLGKAFQVCKLIVGDEFDGGDPTSEWNNLLEDHFKVNASIYVQYVYDYARDLSFAYNEMRETLFADNMICCPDIQLFPKHVLLGFIKTASIRPPVSRDLINTDIRGSITSTGGSVASLAERSNLANAFSRVRFDISSLIKRFHPVHIDITHRHFFYESPILNNKGETVQQTKFCFRRLDTMIKNFKIPTAEEFRNGVQNIRITPSFIEDKKLGDRSIPFYYRYNKNLPINLYWSYYANVRKKEEEIYYYHASMYSQNPAALAPLLFNLLPYSFYRIEGHVGFKYQEVERVLNQLIDDNNLPINIITVQVEKNRLTIKPLPWYFPHLQVYENSIRNTLFDHMNQVELFHNSLKDQIQDQPPATKTNINLSIDNYSNARNKVFSSKQISDPEFNVANFKTDVGSAIKAATDVKVQTREFAFSHAAAPHDFVINTDITHKLDLYTDLVNQHINQKKDGLMLGNFMKQNPGLEHAGGVNRGGTFVLVYTSNDDKVVADFMLPYASIDKDIVRNPPTVKPIPLPVNPKLELPKVFEKIPLYKFFVEDKLKPFDTRFFTLEEKIKPIDDKITFYDKAFSDRVKLIDDKIGSIDKAVKDKFDLVDKSFFDKTKMIDDKLNVVDKSIEEKFRGIDKNVDEKISKYDSTLKDKLLFSKSTVDVKTGTTGRNDNVVGDRDLTKEIEAFKARQKEMEALPAGTREKIVKEQEFLREADSLITALNQAAAAASATDKESALTAKAIMFDVQSSALALQSNQVHTGSITTINTKIGGITKNLNTRIIR